MVVYSQIKHYILLKEIFFKKIHFIMCVKFSMYDIDDKEVIDN